MGKKNRLGAKTPTNSGKLISLSKETSKDYTRTLEVAFELLLTHSTHQPYLELAEGLVKDEGFNWSSAQKKIFTLVRVAQNVCIIIQKHNLLKLKINKDNVKKVLKFLGEQGISPSYLLERIEDAKFRNVCGASKDEIKNIKYNPEHNDISYAIFLSPYAYIMYKILTGEGFTVMDMNKALNIPITHLTSLADEHYKKFTYTTELISLLEGFGDRSLFKIILRSIENKPLHFFEELLFKTHALLKGNLRESEVIDKLVTDISKALDKFLTENTATDIEFPYKQLIMYASDAISYRYLIRNDLEKVLGIISSVLKIFPDAKFDAISKALTINLSIPLSETKCTHIDKILELFLEADLKAEVLSWIKQGTQSVRSLNTEMFKDYCSRKGRINEILNNIFKLNETIDTSFFINQIFFYARQNFDKAFDVVMQLGADPAEPHSLVSEMKHVVFNLLSVYAREDISLEKMQRLEQIMLKEPYQDSLNINMGFFELYYNFCWNDALNLEEKRKYLKLADKHLDIAIKIFTDIKLESCKLKHNLMMGKQQIMLKSMELGLSYKKNMHSIEKIAAQFDLYYLFEKFSSFVESTEKTINKIKYSTACDDKPIRQADYDSSLEIKESAKKIEHFTSAADAKCSEPIIISPKNDVDVLEVQDKTPKRPIEEVIDEEPVEFTEDESRQIALALDQYYKKLKGAKKAAYERESLGIEKVYVWNYRGEEIRSSVEDIITIKENVLYARFAPHFLNKIKKNHDLHNKLDYILREKGISKDSESEGMIYLKNNYWKIRMSNKKVRPIGEETDTSDDIAALVTFFDIWGHQKMDDFINGGCKGPQKPRATKESRSYDASAEEVELQDASMPFWPTEELGGVEVCSEI